MLRSLPFLFALLPVTSASAQTQARILIGVSAYTLGGEESLDVSPVYRLAGGAGVSVGFKGGFSIRPELKYTIQGGEMLARVGGSVEGSDGVPVTATFDLTYLEIPIFLVYGLDLRGGKRLELGAGPAIGLKVDTRMNFAADEGPAIDQGVDGTGRLQAFAAAADLMIPVRGERVLFGVRWWRSQTGAGLENSFSQGFDLRSSGFSFLSGIVF